MKHTREQLDGMSDLEITEVIAKRLGMEVINQSDEAVMCGYDGLRSTVADRNYCNNWNDIMTLAVEYGVNVDFESHNKPSAFKGRNIDPLTNDEYAPDFIFLHDNPQRAIACCLIMVLEDKNV